MRRLFITIAVGTSLLASSFVSGQETPSSAVQKNGINWTKNYSDAVELAQSTSKPILILFTGTNWCPACMKLEREVLKNSEFVQGVGQKFVFLKAEFPDYSEKGMLNSPYKPLFDRYKIDVFPTIVVVDALGEKLFIVNYQKAGPQAYIHELLQKLHHHNQPK
jgi:thioredoxin-related protein